MQLVGALSQGLPPGRVLMEHSGRAGELREMEQICSELSAACWPGCPSGVLTTCLASLRAARTTLHVLHALHAREASQTTMLLSPDK